MSDDHLFDLRRHGKITASIVGAILRCEGCQSRKWAWRVVTGREKVREANWDQQRGLDHEEDAIGAVQLELGCLVLPGRFVCHPVIPWLGASPDGFLVEDHNLIVVEAKCPRVLHSSVPDMYYAQMQVQLECCDAPYGYFVSWTEEGQWIQKVERSEVWWTTNYPILEEFYKLYIAPDIEPPVSPRRSKNVDGRTVARRGQSHKGSDASSVRATPAVEGNNGDSNPSGDGTKGSRRVRKADPDNNDTPRRTRRSKVNPQATSGGQGSGSDSQSESAKAFFATRVAVSDRE